MADAPNSATATTTAPDTPSADRRDPIDAATIRQSYDTVLWALRSPNVDECEHLRGLLLGHVQLLVLEVADTAPLMRGERQRLALHVLRRTRHMLDQGIGTSAQDIWDLATQCRALHLIHQDLRPLMARPVAGERA
ncbi:DUF6415 family natural product biosynthesis protein [Streptomyces sp. HD]|uniref:DUF6415 family natural product biosynthesis protein n=1 Tax=Streptomyces sp. HD TaxID=3020892 RepID=UPI00232C1978|nr:DUF6415 family natural product biosynthesis protein [Streptomyces sp. HD]MDC0773902.1 DUF6415 family natural product biosynthesis protein [Streptomyces sp. HD]